MAKTYPGLKLDRRAGTGRTEEQGKLWDLDSALAYIEGDQPSSRKGKKQVKKSVHSSSANNIGCPKAANNTPNPVLRDYLNETSGAYHVPAYPTGLGSTTAAILEDGSTTDPVRLFTTGGSGQIPVVMVLDEEGPVAN